MKLEKYSFGIGDRFAHQGEAQLKAIIKAKEAGVSIAPIWNKSFREHQTVGSNHAETKKEADGAVEALGWKENYYVDADHINMSNVGQFTDHANFFTLDVANHIGKKADKEELSQFVKSNARLIGNTEIPGIHSASQVTENAIREVGEKYLYAIQKAGEVYRFIADKKGEDHFVAEVSMDETDLPQTPFELLIILSALAHENTQLQTLAPKFSGRFNKGVDYQGDISQFEKEFEADIQILDYATKRFGLPENLKLSIHTGSDKFSIYPVIGKIIRKYGKGIHVKTAGTTWLAEVIGMPLAGDDGLDMAKRIYRTAYDQVESLTEAYAAVIDIDQSRLPLPEKVTHWKADKFVNALRHVPGHPEYNPHFRQLMHVSYKIAAQTGAAFTDLLKKYEKRIASEVTENLFGGHFKRLFFEETGAK
ncbi:MAG: tagaturonate epimerase family protein [Bacteroidales bacterium]|nr:tagaturonate epimerase family protein [Bacteroidales bacterium]